MPACNTFSCSTHLSRGDAIFGKDLDGQPYARLDLPAAKTAHPGEIQQVFLVAQGTLCLLEALRNLAEVVSASATDPLFSWRDTKGEVRPMVRATALSHINTIFQSLGFGNAFGHSFCIGGASYYLSQKVDPEIVRIQGRWKSLAYQVYIRAFEQIASQHLAGLAAKYGY